MISFFPLGSADGIRCPVGTYSNKKGLKNETECSPCDPGQYCNTAGLTSTAGDCTAGHYCQIGAEYATPIGETWGDYCETGHYCPTGECYKVLEILPG